MNSKGKPKDEESPFRLGKAQTEDLQVSVREVSVLDYRDQHLDRANAREVIACIAGAFRRVRPDVVLTFGPDGHLLTDASAVTPGAPVRIALQKGELAATVTGVAPSEKESD